MMMMTNAVLCIALVRATPPGAAADTAGLAKSERNALVKHLADLESAFDGAVTEFAVTSFDYVPVATDATWSPELLESQEPIGNTSYLWAYDDGRVHLSHCSDAPARPAPAPSCATSIWTGEQWVLYAPEREGNAHHLGILLMPRVVSAEYAIPVFNGGVEWRSMVGVLSLGDTLQKGIAISSESIGAGDGRQAVVRVALSKTQTPQVEMRFVYHGNEPELRAVTMDIFESPYDASAPRLKMKFQFHVTKWAIMNGKHVPTEAAYLQGRVGEDGAMKVAGQRLVRQTLVELNEQSRQELFDVPKPQSGDSIANLALGINYEFNGNVIWVNRQRIQLNRQIDQVIQTEAELHDWIGGGS